MRDASIDMVQQDRLRTPSIALKRAFEQRLVLARRLLTDPSGRTICVLPCSVLRATSPTEISVQKGGEVWLTLPPERCRALSR